MVISHKHKFIFIKGSKTAGTSLEVMLSSFCDSNDIFTPIYPQVYPHIARNYKGLFNPLNEIFKSNYKLSHNFYSLLQFVKFKKFYNHIPGSKIMCRLDSKLWKEYTKFTIERNPWDKTVSMYKMLVKTNRYKGNFEDFLMSDRLPINYPKYLSKNGSVLVDKFIYYENLDFELRSFLKSLKIPFDKLNIHAKSSFNNSKNSYREFYKEKWKHEIIKKVFSKEIELHGYEF